MFPRIRRVNAREKTALFQLVTVRSSTAGAGQVSALEPAAGSTRPRAPASSAARRAGPKPGFPWLAENGHGITETETVSGTERLEEVLMTGLRLSGEEFVRAAGSDWQDGIDVSAL